MKLAVLGGSVAALSGATGFKGMGLCPSVHPAPRATRGRRWDGSGAFVVAAGAPRVRTMPDGRQVWLTRDNKSSFGFSIADMFPGSHCSRFGRHDQ